MRKLLSGEMDTLRIDPIEFLSETPDLKFQAIYKEAIRRDVLKPDLCLSTMIKKLRSKEYVYLIAIALRYGANPNIYIRDTHILGYLYTSDRGNLPVEYLNMTVLLLLYYGSNPTKPMYDDEEKGKSVIQWLNSNNKPNILSAAYPDWGKNIDKSTKTLVGILTGDESLIQSPLTEDIIEKIIHAGNTLDDMRMSLDKAIGSRDLLSKCPIPTRVNIDYRVVSWAYDYYDDNAIVYYARMGILMSYPLINKLLLNMKRYIEFQPYLYYVLVKMLEVNVSCGLHMDNYQTRILLSISKTIYDRIMSAYTIPSWKKECSYQPPTDNPSTKLRSLAYGLDIDNVESHKAICRELKSTSETDQSSLRTSLKNRQISRLGVKHGSLSDFSTGITPPILYCVNRSTTVGRPSNPGQMQVPLEQSAFVIDGESSDYGDLSLSSYRDANGDVWCFLSSNYDTMLQTKKNPINNTTLPNSYLNEIERKSKILKGIGSDSPTKTFNSLVSTRDYNWEIDSLSQAHARATFSYILSWYNKYDRESLKIILSKIKSLGGKI